MLELIDYIEEFKQALIVQLVDDQEEKGDYWMTLPRKGQEERIQTRIQGYFFDFEELRIPVPWTKIAGLAFIGWVRETFGGIQNG